MLRAAGRDRGGRGGGRGSDAQPPHGLPQAPDRHAAAAPGVCGCGWEAGEEGSTGWGLRPPCQSRDAIADPPAAAGPTPTPPYPTHPPSSSPAPPPPASSPHPPSPTHTHAQVSTFEAVVNQLRWFAGNQVRVCVRACASLDEPSRGPFSVGGERSFKMGVVLCWQPRSALHVGRNQRVGGGSTVPPGIAWRMPCHAMSLDHLPHGCLRPPAQLPDHASPGPRPRNPRHQIRNVSALGGNIVTGSPISDLNPIWMAAGATFVALGRGSGERAVPASGFFVGYRQVRRGHAWRCCRCCCRVQGAGTPCLPPVCMFLVLSSACLAAASVHAHTAGPGKGYSMPIMA